MTRRVSLPGAAELFRVTGDSPAEASVEAAAGPVAAAAPVAPVAVRDVAAPRTDDRDDTAPHRARTVAHDDWEPAPSRPIRRRRPAGADRRPTGRERHEEKITVYCSAEELIDLEQARLTLRGDFGLAVDRGRIVREAIAVVLADLEAKGESSILLRRLRGI
jgi:hypothetical protein